MKFGQALEALERGEKIAREGWNGKGMFLFLLPGGTVPTKAIYDKTLRDTVEKEVGSEFFEALPTIRMFTADKKSSQDGLLLNLICLLTIGLFFKAMKIKISFGGH